MNTLNTFEEILSAALALPLDMRAMLVDHLLASLDGLSQEEIDAAWAEEAERRMQEIRDGKAQPIDGALVMRELRARRQPDRQSTLKDLLTDVTEKNRHPEVDFSHPVGKEKL